MPNNRRSICDTANIEKLFRLHSDVKDIIINKLRNKNSFYLAPRILLNYGITKSNTKEEFALTNTLPFAGYLVLIAKEDDLHRAIFHIFCQYGNV